MGTGGLELLGEKELRMNEILYYGLEKIKTRLGVSKDKAREWCRSGLINAKKDPVSGSWVINESTISEDIRNLPVALAGRGL